MNTSYKRKPINSFVSEFYTALFFLLSIASASSQAPEFGWAQQFGGPNGGWAQAVAADASGDVYVTGYFQNTNLTFGTTTLTNTGNYDAFLVKFDPAGNVLWARQTGGSGSVNSRHLCLGSDGSIYVGGWLGVGSLNFGNSNLTNIAGTHCFVMKYDSSGNPVWATQSSGNGTEFGMKVATDLLGNVYLTGEFQGTNCTFGTNFFSTSQNSPFGADVFITKYDSLGNLLWAKRAGGSSDDHAGGVGVDAAGNCYISGTFSGFTMDFQDVSLNQGGYYNIFLAKYDHQGSLVWAKGAGGNGFNSVDWGNALAVDAAGNSYLAGVLGSPIASFDGITITNRGVNDMFAAKYDNAGNILWATNCGGTDYDGAFDAALDSSNSLYVLGGFRGVSIFGNATLTNVISSEQMFIAKFDSAGSPVWAQQTTGSGNSTGPTGISVDSKGNTYTVGFFKLALAFGKTTLTANDYTMFVAKLNGPPLLKTSVLAGQLKLSWPSYQTGFVLESATAANGPWTQVTGDISVIDNQNVVTDTILGTSKFYRLKKP